MYLIYLILVLAVAFADCASSALVISHERRQLGSLPERITFSDDNCIAPSRTKRQVAVDVAPPAVAAPLPATKATTKPALEIDGLDIIDQLSQVGDRVGQRLNARLDKLQSGVDTLVSSQVDAITDLFKSGISTGAKIPATGLKLLVAKLRLPLYVFG